MTRIYYFVSFNGSVVYPATVSSPNNHLLTSNIESSVQGLVVYDEILKRRYRFHYELLIDEFVYAENFSDFTLAIQQVWNNDVQGQCVCVTEHIYKGFFYFNGIHLPIIV